MSKKVLQKNLKLPQIPSKSSSTIPSEQSVPSSRTRPLSSKKLNDLQKNLFSQLDQYEDLDNKIPKKVRTKKNRQTQQAGDIDAPYLKKLQKLLPETYNKLLSSSKPQPLQQNIRLNGKPHTSKQLNHKSSKASAQQKLSSTTNFCKKGKGTTVQKAQGIQTSFDVAEREVEAIYQQYLLEEGLTELNEMSSCSDLTELNREIESTEGELKALKKEFETLVNKFGTDCLEDNIDFN